MLRYRHLQMASLRAVSMKSSGKALPLASATLIRLVDSGLCTSCRRQWHRHSLTISEQVFKSLRFTSRKFTLLGPRFLAVKKDKNDEEELHDERIYTHNWIGPPDPVSNLREFKFKRQRNPNKYDLLLEKERRETHKWNNDFWTHHNNRFFMEKKEFSKELEAKGISDKEGSDEMSQFYKYFLDRHYQLHVNYNKEWYKRNFRMLLLAVLASLTRIIKR